MTTLSLQITGMSCANCAARIEREVAALPGVETSVVNFAIAQLSASFDEQITSPETIIEKVQSLGFGVIRPEPPGELTFGVSGLHCASCVARLEKALLEHSAIDRKSVV
mgnify:CR=1 FL=1